MPLPSRRLRSKRRSGWPAKPHFRATIAMTRHGTARFYRVWRSHPLPIGWPAEREIPASRALSAPPSSPRTRPDREASNRSVMAPGEVAEWSNAPHSKCGIGASLSGVRIPPSPPVFKSHPPLSHREKSLKSGNSNWAGTDGNGRCWGAKRSFVDHSIFEVLHVPRLVYRRRPSIICQAYFLAPSSSSQMRSTAFVSDPSRSIR